MALRFTYKDAGVDIESLDQFKVAIRAHQKRTFGPRVIDNPGGFAGLFRLKGTNRLFWPRYRDPVLVSCTDGVGTKLKIAFMMDKHDTVGRDLVAMSVNDLVTLGAEPLFFLDYIASSQIHGDRLEQLIRGIADGCQEAGCTLLGGETAQMPGFYAPDHYDLAGFAVGVVERRRIVDGRAVEPGDVVLGVASSGLHSNGYSLARKVLLEHAKLPLDKRVEELGGVLGEEMLRPTRIYARAIAALRAAYRVKRIPTAIANITGGGMPDNIVRVLPRRCSVRVKKGSWPVPPIFGLIRKLGNVEEQEMFRVFNMGIGMVVIVPPYYADAAARHLKRAGETAYVIGQVVRSGKRSVTIA